MDEITTGALIRDRDLRVLARVVSNGYLKFGRKQLPGYRVTFLSGRQQGHTGFILQNDAVFVAPPSPNE